MLFKHMKTFRKKEKLPILIIFPLSDNDLRNACLFNRVYLVSLDDITNDLMIWRVCARLSIISWSTLVAKRDSVNYSFIEHTLEYLNGGPGKQASGHNCNSKTPCVSLTSDLDRHCAPVSYINIGDTFDNQLSSN